jgi:hypothetical protein
MVSSEAKKQNVFSSEGQKTAQAGCVTASFFLWWRSRHFVLFAPLVRALPAFVGCGSDTHPRFLRERRLPFSTSNRGFISQKKKEEEQSATQAQGFQNHPSVVSGPGTAGGTSGDPEAGGLASRREQANSPRASDYSDRSKRDPLPLLHFIKNTLWIVVIARDGLCARELAGGVRTITPFARRCVSRPPCSDCCLHQIAPMIPPRHFPLIYSH